MAGNIHYRQEDAVKNFRTSRQEGATAVEYALMAGLITVVIAFSVGVLGNSLLQHFANAAALI